MQKLYMSFGSDHNRISRAAPPQYARAAAPQSVSRAQGKRTAIQNMMNVYAKKTGGGCGSCGGAK